ncbi:guanosine-3',5'-bis(diphosphate) 3'-pyrophosphohydrolase [Amylibacter marinus]|uniref:GTP pyrophosphokinase rsh n=1 Tax=Amylibacter marinus TaxID=1475483 RepID=A0ABQ5VUV2_9RHOB|nr:bifunctional (p)ppGpp synthetase/guanosine-3',5'-bis(diphosphate) 3'-pyrophosphohydrolase [Amylibacter marinus]GLQ35050.1 guanosine-3',5'-bis(diphosphate) 3'-pyrophosphohydrolase [Amylibacter marinus]
MIDVETLVDHVREYNPKTNADLIRRAYAYGMKMHEGQKRHSGEPYFTHPVAVADIMAEQKLDDATIVTALLHDTVEDTKLTHQMLAAEFGEEISQLVDGVTKLTNLELSSKQTKQAENFRKLLLAMSKDLRVILVKLGDRLHNMRTIKHMPEHKQVQKSHETMDVFAPLAGRMGMQWMRDELEDLCFKVLNPEARSSIMRRFITMRDKSDDLIPRIIKDIHILVDANNIEATITGREKKPYSIWRKMEEKQQSFSRLSDIYGFRIITETEQDAYAALGAVHQRWTCVPGRFKDYISAPKSNGYRSIHTSVAGRDGKLVEIQIRTKEMHEVAEVGVAAHWAYKDGKRTHNRFSVDPLEWLSKLTDGFGNVDDEDHEEFLENVKLEMFSDQVFCFTPKGDVIKLPRGATPIDFAFAIHTRIGSACVGAKVDGSRVPLWTRLRNGQSVEIQTAVAQRPQATWIDIVKTGRAKSAIRKALREDHQVGYRKLGQELARVALEHVGKSASPKALETAARKMGLKDRDELLAQIGSAEITGVDLVRALYPALLQDQADQADTPLAKIVGLSAGQYVQGANCCQPLPGERIVGITTRGTGVEVHSIHCEKLVDYEDQTERWIDLNWTQGRTETVHIVTLEVTMANYTGVLGRICILISEQEANIADMHFSDRKQDYFRIAIDIEVRDVKHLANVITAVEADSDVAGVVQSRRSSVSNAQ